MYPYRYNAPVCYTSGRMSRTAAKTWRQRRQRGALRRRRQGTLGIGFSCKAGDITHPRELGTQSRVGPQRKIFFFLEPGEATEEKRRARMG